VGDEIDVTVDSVAFGGDGVARHDGYVIFVPDVVPGERVRVRLEAVKRSYGRGALLEVLEASPDRVEPRCAVYGLCGGCQYQHMTYDAALKIKEGHLGEVAERIGGLSFKGESAPIRRSPETWNYRNAISLRVRRAEAGWEACYSARDNETLVPVRTCPIAAEAINDLIADVESIMQEFERPDDITGINVKCASGRTLVFPRYRRPYRFESAERLTYIYNDLAFLYGPRSFFQVNPSMIPVLLDLAREGLLPDGRAPGTLFDLYAGVGLFSIALAGEFSRVVAVEVARESVDCLRENIRANHAGNVKAVRGAVEKVLPEVYRKHKGEVNSVLVDPPREGLNAAAVRFLTEAPVERLIYVSCDPATLARDLKMLSRRYAIRRITPVDMFPQTAHLEVVAVLGRL
jgi:23S rRNA (uracil1939-C5)-methyltransferase